MAIETALKEFSIEFTEVNLGEVCLKNKLKEAQKELFREKIESIGFELLSDRKSQMIEKVKNVIVEIVHYQDQSINNTHIREILSNKINYSYSSLSKLFSEVEGVTIEKYYINQKVEKIKELLEYDELNINEIAFNLGYSSVQHLSNQFKKVTGMSPSSFKKANEKIRKPLDEV